MAEKKPKTEKLKIETRIPQKRGIFDNLGKGKQENVKHPFSEIINISDESSAGGIDSKAVQSTPRTQPTPPTPFTTQSQRVLPVAPEKDFQKVANSIVREAMPQGFFIGKSKQIYDYLYLMTRGAIQPKRSVRITKANLMRGAHIGSERTLLKNLAHLRSTGLVKVTEFEGEHGGNEYETFLPEEANPTPPTPPTTHQSPHAVQKVGTLPPVESGVSGVALIYENKEALLPLRLNTKTNTIDDETSFTFSGFIKKFENVSKKLTGKGVSRKELEKWEALAELLILELEVAAKRSGRVSSVPAFLTEVLRRQFFVARREQRSSSAKSAQVKPDTVGKSESENFEIKPLDEQGREAALEQLREFAGESFLEDFKKWYTPADWQWLTEQLEVSKTEK